MRLFKVPYFDVAQLVEAHGMNNCFGRDFCRKNALRGPRQGALAIEQFSLKRQGIPQGLEVLQKTIDLNTWMCAENIFGSDEDVFNKGRWNYTQENFAVDASKRQIVDFIAERRNIRPLIGVKSDRQDIFTGKVEVGRQLKEKWRVSPPILSNAGAVDPNGGGRHRSFEVDEHSLTASFLWKLEMPAISGNELVSLLVETVPWQAHVSGRDKKPPQTSVVKTLSIGSPGRARA